MDVPRSIRRAGPPPNGGDAGEHGGFLAEREEAGRGEIGAIARCFELAIRARRVNLTLDMNLGLRLTRPPLHEQRCRT